MKKITLLKIENILLIIASLGVVLRLLKVLGGGIIVTFSFLTLSILYFVMVFTSFKTWKTSKAVSLINTMLYFLLAGIVTAILYFIMLWPGGQNQVFQTIKIYFFIICVSLIYSLINRGQTGIIFWNGVKGAFVKSSIFLFIALILSLLPNELLIKAFAQNPQSIQERLENNYQQE